jgi:hypothetical protein
MFKQLPNEIIDINDIDIDFELNDEKFMVDCYITKNTLEIRDKLINLGYRPSNTFDEKSPYIWAQSNGVFFDSRNLDIANVSLGNYTSPYGICCGENENLFLSIAALRRDTDKNQWFVSKFKNEWFFCENDFCEYKLKSDDCWTKATVDDLITHFKI